MGGLFGLSSNEDCVMDLFFGTDYHSHLGTRRGGMVVFGSGGFNRAIHNIENTPFRTKFEKDISEMSGNAGIGSISDGEPQPLTVRNRLIDFAITTVGRINNKQKLIDEILKDGQTQFMAMSGGEINNTELVAALVSRGESITEGIELAQQKIEGSVTMLILTPDGIYAARDKRGRTPLVLGKKDGAVCASSESFAFLNLGYKFEKELGPGEIVFFDSKNIKTLVPPGNEMKMCTFMWSYYGYTTSTYEGVNVEQMRYRTGESLAEKDKGILADCVAGVPDSGTAHAIGYANYSGIPFARPFIKYTPTWPRSFMPQNQKARNLIARMKLIPILEIIRDKKIVLIDDSIVRGTQLFETVNYLYENGAKEVHVRTSCPPIMFGCKYLNFSRSKNEMDLITRRVIHDLENGEVSDDILNEYAESSSLRHKKMVDEICKRLGFTSLRFHELEDTLNAVGIDKCKLCTYCWNGKE